MLGWNAEHRGPRKGILRSLSGKGGFKEAVKAGLTSPKGAEVTGGLPCIPVKRVG